MALAKLDRQHFCRLFFSYHLLSISKCSIMLSRVAWTFHRQFAMLWEDEQMWKFSDWNLLSRQMVIKISKQTNEFSAYVSEIVDIIELNKASRSLSTSFCWFFNQVLFQFIYTGRPKLGERICFCNNIIKRTTFLYFFILFI